MPEYVARRLLAESGSWQRLHSELQSGTGLGHGLVPAERRALLDRFNATREQMARDVAGMFQGTVVSAETGSGPADRDPVHRGQGTEHATAGDALSGHQEPRLATADRRRAAQRRPGARGTRHPGDARVGADRPRRPG